MTTEQKQQIADMLRAYCARKGSQNKAANSPMFCRSLAMKVRRFQYSEQTMW